MPGKPIKMCKDIRSGSKLDTCTSPTLVYKHANYGSLRMLCCYKGDPFADR